MGVPNASSYLSQSSADLAWWASATTASLLVELCSDRGRWPTYYYISWVLLNINVPKKMVLLFLTVTFVMHYMCSHDKLHQLRLATKYVIAGQHMHGPGCWFHDCCCKEKVCMGAAYGRLHSA